MNASEALTRFAELDHELRQIEQRKEAIEKEMGTLEPVILNDWETRNQQNAKVGNVTIFIRSDFYCSKSSAVSTADVCRALESHGLGILVSPNYNAAALKARIKSMDEADLVPDELKRVLNFDYTPRLRTRLS
jgi:hypothetical protein